MPNCCNLSIISFDGQASTVINYTAELQASFGQLPSVRVYYRDPVTGRLDGAVTHVALNMPVTSIRIDHGGVASGFVKLTK